MRCSDNDRVSADVKSTEIQSRVREIHWLDFQKNWAAVGAHLKFSVLNSVTEWSFAIRRVHRGDAVGFGSAAQPEPVCLSRMDGNVGAQQCDFFIGPSLHSLRLRSPHRDPAWKKEQRWRGIHPWELNAAVTVIRPQDSSLSSNLHAYILVSYSWSGAENNEEPELTESAEKESC